MYFKKNLYISGQLQIVELAPYTKESEVNFLQFIFNFMLKNTFKYLYGLLVRVLNSCTLFLLLYYVLK